MKVKDAGGVGDSQFKAVSMVVGRGRARRRSDGATLSCLRAMVEEELKKSGLGIGRSLGGG